MMGKSIMHLKNSKRDGMYLKTKAKNELQDNFEQVDWDLVFMVLHDFIRHQLDLGALS